MLVPPVRRTVRRTLVAPSLMEAVAALKVTLESISLMVTVAVAGDTRMPPEGALNATRKVSLFSYTASLSVATVISLLTSSSAKLSVVLPTAV